MRRSEIIGTIPTKAESDQVLPIEKSRKYVNRVNAIFASQIPTYEFKNIHGEKVVRLISPINEVSVVRTNEIPLPEGSWLNVIDIIDPIVDYKMRKGQTENASYRGFEEDPDVISIGADELRYSYQFHTDGRVTLRSRYFKDYNPSVDPDDRYQIIKDPCIPTVTVPLWEEDAKQSNILEIEHALDYFEHNASIGMLQGRLKPIPPIEKLISV